MAKLKKSIYKLNSFISILKLLLLSILKLRKQKSLKRQPMPLFYCINISTRFHVELSIPLRKTKKAERLSSSKVRKATSTAHFCGHSIYGHS